MDIKNNIIERVAEPSAPQFGGQDHDFHLSRGEQDPHGQAKHPSGGSKAAQLAAESRTSVTLSILSVIEVHYGRLQSACGFSILHAHSTSQECARLQCSAVADTTARSIPTARKNLQDPKRSCPSKGELTVMILAPSQLPSKVPLVYVRASR